MSNHGTIYPKAWADIFPHFLQPHHTSHYKFSNSPLTNFLRSSSKVFFDHIFNFPYSSPFLNQLRRCLALRISPYSDAQKFLRSPATAKHVYRRGFEAHKRTTILLRVAPPEKDCRAPNASDKNFARIRGYRGWRTGSHQIYGGWSVSAAQRHESTLMRV